MPSPHTLFKNSSSDYSQPHFDNFGDFLRRLTFAMASTFSCASPSLLFENYIRLTQFHISSPNFLHDATDFSSIPPTPNADTILIVFGTNFRYLETLIYPAFSTGPLILINGT